MPDRAPGIQRILILQNRQGGNEEKVGGYGWGHPAEV